jgi:RNA polymerase primary sigma factor
MMRSNMLCLAGVVLGMLVTTGCQTNPYTGRWQLMMMPMSQETQMGAQAYAEVKNDPKMKQSTDPREIEPVKRVAARVIEAAKRFDPDKNVKFITYAVWWIRQSIIHALSDQSGPFRLPQKQANLLYRIGKTQAALTSQLERPPSVEEIAKTMDIDPEDVMTLLQVSDDNISLSAVIDEEHEFHLSDKLEQEVIPSADAVLVRDALRTQVRQSLSELDEKERKVLLLRFGLTGEEPKTLKEIGEAMSLSRERIRQIEAQALKKLNRSSKCQQLRSYLN